MRPARPTATRSESVDDGQRTDFLAADGVTATYSRAAGETVLGGPYHITATLAPAAVLANYTITNTGSELHDQRRGRRRGRRITQQQDLRRCGSEPLTTGSGTNFVAADGVTATYSRAAGETVLGGPYHITATLSSGGRAVELHHHEHGRELHDHGAAGDVDDQRQQQDLRRRRSEPLTTGSGSTSWRPTA